MKIEVIIEEKTYIYHVPRTCNANLIIRDGKVEEVLESKKIKPVE